jgi:pilus assembly protein FimV
MRRHLPRLLLLGALLSPMTLYALGLGEIRLHSALNQPFDAEIELISPTADELAALKVGLASPDLYQRYGIDRPQYLSNFTFSVRRSGDGRASIKVSSSRSVTEPFVTILVEASWARGRLLREYTVLLDPPVFMPSQPEAPAPVTTPQAGTQQGRIERPVAQQPKPEPQPSEATPLPRPAERTQEPVTSASAGTSITGEYNVQRNDTLWRIASGVTPGGTRREINRTMIALFRANPAAFNGNINRLRSGSVLRIPELADIEAISTGEATAEVARQAAEWSGAQPTQVAQEEANRLRLVTPQETPAAPSPGTPAPEQVAKAPPTTPTTTGPTPQDNRVALPNQGLAATQQSAAETPVEAAPQPEATTQEPTAQQTEPTAETPPTTEQAAPPKPVSRPPVQTPAEPTPSLLDRVNEYWWVLVVLGVLVVIGLAVAFVRRRREEASVASDAMAGLDFEPRSTRAAPAMSPATKARDRDSFLVEDSDDDTLGGLEEPSAPTSRRTEPTPTKARETVAAAPVAAAAAGASPRLDETMSSETQVRFDQQDALAEADFHMAYGLYDQAADLVKIAIEREPARRDLKLKLLEIYFVWGNKDLFLDTARELHGSRAQAAPSEWDKVLIMGKQIAPDDAMFKGEAGAAHVDLVDVNLEGGENRVDVDLFAEPDDKPAGLDLEFTSGERKAPAASGSSNDLDFLLDEPKRGADEEPTREFDALSRTQETPTIETPQIDRSAQTMRERTIREKAAKAEQTAELSLDDLGLDVDSLEASGSLEDTTSLEKDPTAQSPAPIRDDEMTQLAPSIGNFDRTMKAPREKFDIETTGTIYIDQVDLAGGDTVEQPRVPENDSTAEMKRPSPKDLDLDLDHLSGSGSGPETVRQNRGGERDDDNFSSDVFADRTSEVPRVDLDVGEPLSGDDGDTAHRRTIAGGDVGLSELEPVTMSEVGTKLDLARAYMDMGDPDGARSILEEVLSEGNASQKQEAQRLMESIR